MADEYHLVPPTSSLAGEDGVLLSGSSLELPNDLPFRRQILQLRYLGYEVPEIAELLSSSIGTVQYQLNAAISASSNSERLTVVREAEICKLEELEAAFMPHALAANDRSAKVVLDIMDRRSKLLGVDKALPTSGGNLTLIQILSQLPQINEGAVIDA
jgi:hypothetical protein